MGNHEAMTYISDISNELVIDDSTDIYSLRDPVIDGVQRRCACAPRDWEAEPFGSFAAPFALPLIPRSEWDDRIEEMDRKIWGD